MASLSISICCPQCGSSQVSKRGKTEQGKQRYICLNQACSTNTFISRERGQALQFASKSPNKRRCHVKCKA
ncbi:IS1/IS1595 family N-terminal zinc-binding domain-containing protein [Methylocucumis oryzae]|uniref:IS1/IS1595 family N-terminal zinc-binding domain-containing protein n=1 Tax=Methylocucumis oryzae TaxID=1632867 RepID=UPI0009E42880